MLQVNRSLVATIPLSVSALTKAIKLVAFSLIFVSWTHVYAAAYRPTNDAAVIDTLPVGSRTFQTRMQLNPAVKQPFSMIEPQISALMARAYSQGDPRAVGQAEALLEPYRADTTPQVMMVRANIDQSNHRFEDARLELKAILKKLPNQPLQSHR